MHWLWRNIDCLVIFLPFRWSFGVVLYEIFTVGKFTSSVCVLGALWLCITVLQVMFQSQFALRYDPDHSVMCSWRLQLTAFAHRPKAQGSLDFCSFHYFYDYCTLLSDTGSSISKIRILNAQLSLLECDFVCSAIGSSILDNSKVCFSFPLMYVAIAIAIIGREKGALWEGSEVLSGGALSTSIDNSSYVELPEVLMLN